MILFSKLRWKNFLSTGNVFTELNLSKSKTTLISGSNGAGKSSLLDALTFGLYGKPFRKINKPQLISSINQKDMMVEIEFSIEKDQYLIRRGMKPNIFEIYKNDILINQDAATKDYQAYLENNILKINFKAFTQVVILGSATYIPFMELPAQQRREVIEDLLDIKIFSTMNTLLKDKIITNRELITSKKYDIDLIQTKLDAAKKHNDAIRKMKTIEIERIKERVQNLLTDIEVDKEDMNKIQLEIEDLLFTVSDKSKIQERHNKILSIRAELSARKLIIEKELSFYNENDVCPVCKQDLEHKTDIIFSQQKALEEVISALNGLETKMKETNDRFAEISKVEAELQRKNNSISEYRANINLKKKQLNEIKKDLDSAKKEIKEIDNSDLLEYSKTLELATTAYTEAVEQREIFGVVSTLLKDNGIKSKIISQFIPVMNTLINKYLASFDLFVDFQLDENFNEVIKSRFRDTFSYASFSEGEKLKISLAIMLTWRTVAKMRNSTSTNLLIMDEVLDGSADASGVDSLIEILNTLNSNDNVFIISHRGQTFGDKFEEHIEFEKVKNFSQIKISDN